MPKTTDRKRGVATSSGAALAAVMLASPGLAAPAPVQQAEQVPPIENSGRAAAAEKGGIDWGRPGPLKIGAEFKHKGEYAVAGVGDGNIVFEDERGNLFYIDKSTGDQKFVSRKYFAKVEIHRNVKRMGGKISLLGVDQNGKVIMANKRGEKFYLDPATGDMIFVK